MVITFVKICQNLFTTVCNFVRVMFVLNYKLIRVILKLCSNFFLEHNTQCPFEEQLSEDGQSKALITLVVQLKVFLKKM